MALNIPVFKTRTLTAILFVMVMLLGLLWNNWSLIILFLIIHFAAWFEYQKLIERINPAYTNRSRVHQYSVMLIGGGGMLYAAKPLWLLGYVNIHNIGGLTILVGTIVFCIIEIIFKKNLDLRVLKQSALGLLYISCSLALLLHIHKTGYKNLSGQYLILLFVASIWVNDTMAYIVGSIIGKHSLSKISPKKTWEGTIGGGVFCVIVVSLICFFYIRVPLSIAIPTAAIASIMGTFGDLVESKLKRTANVKDSGKFLPAHGGCLDRFDSLLFATPFLWLWITVTTIINNWQ